MEEDDDDDSSVDDNVILRLRDRLLTLLELCFSQYIPSSDEHGDDDTTVAKHSDEQIRVDRERQRLPDVRLTRVGVAMTEIQPWKETRRTSSESRTSWKFVQRVVEDIVHR